MTQHVLADKVHIQFHLSLPSLGCQNSTSPQKIFSLSQATFSRQSPLSHPDSQPQVRFLLARAGTGSIRQLHVPIRPLSRVLRHSLIAHTFATCPQLMPRYGSRFFLFCVRHAARSSKSSSRFTEMTTSAFKGSSSHRQILLQLSHSKASIAHASRGYFATVPELVSGN
jgi:hypothetical protein